MHDNLDEMAMRIVGEGGKAVWRRLNERRGQVFVHRMEPGLA